MKLVSDHGWPKGDGSHPDDEPFPRFINERDYIAQSGRMTTTVAAMDWAAREIDRLRAENAVLAESERHWKQAYEDAKSLAVAVINLGRQEHDEPI